MKRPLRIALWTTAAVALVVFLWLAFRQASPGPLALLVVGKTNTLGKPRVILQFTNGTPRDQRIVFVNVERDMGYQWQQDTTAVKTFKPPLLVVPQHSGFVLTCDLPEPKVVRRFTMLCLPERSRVELREGSSLPAGGTQGVANTGSTHGGSGAVTRGYRRPAELRQA